MFVLAGLIALVPGAGAVWGVAASAIGFIVRCKPCMYALGVAALCGWTALHVHRADVAHCEQRLADDHARTEIARQQRDGAIAEDLDKTYKPKIALLQGLNQSLQEKVKQYENAKPVAGKPAAGRLNCKLGAAAGVLQPAPPR